MENRIEQKMQQLKQKGKKAFITYMMAGHPDMEKCKSLIQAQEHAGVDVLELGIPFSDPVDTGRILSLPCAWRQSQKSICADKGAKRGRDRACDCV